MGIIDDLTKQLLEDVLADFLAKELGSDALNAEYVGPSLSSLKTKYCGGSTYSEVDFDLAIKQLETNEYIKTGPMAPYENPSGTSLLVIAIFSKREFCYLTEKGYRAAKKSTPVAKAPQPTVHISGGTFHQSSIGIGSTVNQSVSFNISNDSEVIEYLSKLLTQHEPSAGTDPKSAVAELVSTAKTGDLGRAKPLFDRLFGSAKETIRQLAWGLITAYVSKQLGL